MHIIFAQLLVLKMTMGNIHIAVEWLKYDAHLVQVKNTETYIIPVQAAWRKIKQHCKTGN